MSISNSPEGQECKRRRRLDYVNSGTIVSLCTSCRVSMLFESSFVISLRIKAEHLKTMQSVRGINRVSHTEKDGRNFDLQKILCCLLEATYFCPGHVPSHFFMRCFPLLLALSS